MLEVVTHFRNFASKSCFKLTAFTLWTFSSLNELFDGI